MRDPRTLLLLAALALTPPTAAQLVPDNDPAPPPVPFDLDSGELFNPAATTEVVYAETIRVAGAAWLRLYFGDVVLANGSYLRITSELDGEVQQLDADALAMWSNTSAYFNGDTLLVEVVAGPLSTNRLIVEQIAYHDGASPTSICGIDDRVPTDLDWSGRVEPIGCTGSIWLENSCIVSAGHCANSIGEAEVIEFRVPSSTNDCQNQHPSVSDQFPITEEFFQEGGIGNDWSVATTGTNDLGQTPFERYGVMRELALGPAAVGQSMAMWGFGSDDECINDNVQQLSLGTVTNVDGNDVAHDADTLGGSSGSGILVGEEIVAIHTHAGCPANRGTRVDHPVFAQARAMLCLSEAGEVRFGRAVYSCDTAMVMRVEDVSLIGGAAPEVTLTSDTEVLDEVVSLTEAYTAVFGGTLPTSGTAPVQGDGLLSVSHGDTITATYDDVDDGTGAAATSVDTATVDCVAPVISDVQVGSITETGALVTWLSDEPSTSSVSLDGPGGSTVFSDSELVTSHAIFLEGLVACAEYTFSVSSTDFAGNEATDDNAGNLYGFDSVCPGAPPVPDGSAGTDPMLVRKVNVTTLRVSWDNACVATGPTKIVYGPLGGVATYAISGAVCGIPATSELTNWTNVPGESLWFVVIKDTDLFVESSWGSSTAGERNGDTASGECGALDKNPSETCP